VNSHKVRKTGEGKRLMQFSIDKIREIYPEDDIKISAQSYLLQFYKDLGFEPTGEEYLEDDIPHTGMVHKIS
jgi:ElaA protein